MYLLYLFSIKWLTFFYDIENLLFFIILTILEMI